MKKVNHHATGQKAGSTFPPANFPVILTILVLFASGLAALRVADAAGIRVATKLMLAR